MKISESGKTSAISAFSPPHCKSLRAALLLVPSYQLFLGSFVLFTDCNISKGWLLTSTAINTHSYTHTQTHIHTYTHTHAHKKHTPMHTPTHSQTHIHTHTHTP